VVTSIFFLFLFRRQCTREEEKKLFPNLIMATMTLLLFLSFHLSARRQATTERRGRRSCTRSRLMARVLVRPLWGRRRGENSLEVRKLDSSWPESERRHLFVLSGWSSYGSRMWLAHVVAVEEEGERLTCNSACYQSFVFVSG
jgi:hypothetical protein